MTTVDFVCPSCGLSCQLNEEQRAVRHAEPTCLVWRQHKGKSEEFLVLALKHASVVKGNLILGGTADRGERSSEALRKERNETLEQIYEGIKKL